MADEMKFSHITVSTSEDDIVIEAGATSSKPGASVYEQEQKHVSQPIQEHEHVLTGEQSEEFQVVPEEVQADQEQTQERKQESSSDYHGTTLEDLQGTSMSLMQKIIIVACVVAIVVALLYYFLVMR